MNYPASAIATLVAASLFPLVALSGSPVEEAAAARAFLDASSGEMSMVGSAVIVLTDDTLCRDMVCIPVVHNPWYPGVNDAVAGFYDEYVAYLQIADEMRRCTSSACEETAKAVGPYLPFSELSPWRD